MEPTFDTSKVLILEDFFNSLSTIEQRRVFQSAFRRATKVLVNAAKANVSVKTGNLRRSIGTTIVYNEVAILVGAKKANKGWHGHLIENGTTERVRKTKGNAPTGKVTGTNFFEQAYDSTSDVIHEDIADYWYEEIERYIVKINNKLK